MNAAKVEARDTIYQRMKAGEYIREELTPDGLHPNDKGHKLVAEEIEKFLESVKAVQYRKTIQLPAARAELVLDGDKEKAILLDGNFDEDWGDCLYLEKVLHRGEKKIHTVDITILPEDVTDTTPFYLMSLIIA